MNQLQAETTQEERKLQIPWAGLGTALVWAISPIFIRAGLADLPSPLIGVAIGLSVNVLAYGVLLWVRRAEWHDRPIPREALYWQIGAAVFVALATWARWIALETVPVGVVSAVERLSVPVVIMLSLLMLDQKHERVNRNVWIGGAMIVAGAIILTFTS